MPFIEKLVEAGRPIRPDDIEPEIDGYARVIVDIFFDLSQYRGSSGFGPNPISIVELEAYCRLFGAELSLFEIRMIKQIDVLYLKAYSEKPT